MSRYSSAIAFVVSAVVSHGFLKKLIRLTFVASDKHIFVGRNLYFDKLPSKIERY